MEPVPPSSEKIRPLGRRADALLYSSGGLTILGTFLLIMTFFLYMGMIEGFVNQFAFGKVTMVDGVVTKSKIDDWYMEFQYEVDGVTYTGFSHGLSKLKKGMRTQIEVSSWHPLISRMRGLSYYNFKYWYLAVLFLLGLAGFFVANYYVKYQTVKTLESGGMSKAKWQKSELISEPDDEYPNAPFVYEHTYRYTTHDKIRRTITCERYKKSANADNSMDWVLYHPSKTEAQFLLEDLPKGFDLDEAGQWVPPNKHDLFNINCMKMLHVVAIMLIIGVFNFFLSTIL